MEACFSGEAKLCLKHHVCTTQSWCDMAAPTANFDLGSFNPQHALFLHALLNNLEKYSRSKLLDIGEKREENFCWGACCQRTISSRSNAEREGKNIIVMIMIDPLSELCGRCVELLATCGLVSKRLRI